MFAFKNKWPGNFDHSLSSAQKPWPKKVRLGFTRISEQVPRLKSSQQTTLLAINPPPLPRRGLPWYIQTSIPSLHIMAEQLIHRGTLEGHNGWVTSLATSLEK